MKLLLILILLLIPAVTTAEECNSLTGVCNPAGSEQNWELAQLVSQGLKFVLGFVGLIFLILFIYAGFTWMTARGNADQIKKARGTMVWAVLGLIIIFSSYIIVAFVLKSINF